MPGPLTTLTFPTPADLRGAGWSTWWRKHKLPPSPDQLLPFCNEAFWHWRDDLMQEHSNYLAVRLGDRLLPLFDLVADLVKERFHRLVVGVSRPRRGREGGRHQLDPVRDSRACASTYRYEARRQPTRSDLRRREYVPALPAAAAGHTCTCVCAKRCRRRCHAARAAGPAPRPGQAKRSDPPNRSSATTHATDRAWRQTGTTPLHFTS